MSATRLLPFDVRPFHRETLESYSARLLAANFCDDRHRADMTRPFLTGRSADAQKEAWMQVLTTRTKRSTLDLAPHPTGWLTHGFGLQCHHFLDTLPTRYACTLCARGNIVEQNPHFDDIVCTTHSRWLGLWGNPTDQHHVTPDAVDAQRTFDKLRRKGLLDVRLYLLVIKALAQELHGDLSPEEAEPRVFVAAIRTIQAITADSFARRFFNPAGRYADAYAHLDDVVTDSAGEPCPSTTQALWIYLRSTMLSLRDAITLNAPFEIMWEHEYPLKPQTAKDLSALRVDLEPVDNYLAITGDTPVTAAHRIAELSKLHSFTEPAPLRSFTCDNGHQFEFLPPVTLTGTGPAAAYIPACGLCTSRRVRPGINDVETMSPAAATQFDVYRNGGLTAADVAISSSTTHWWLCEQGHSHEASPSKKTLPSYKCALCSNRFARAGVNCLLTTHPEKAAMWAEGWAERRSPSTLTAGSRDLAKWRCDNGHIFFARPWELTSGTRNCDSCERVRTVRYEDSLAVTHPDIAARLHRYKNGDLTAELMTHGERRSLWWTCADGHDYKARIDKITLGQGCSECSGRKLIPGKNDLGTVEPLLSIELHPTLNLKEAEEMFPSDHKLWWQCLANEHVHPQTTQNRRQSKGCPKCDIADRILV